ncbi:hypothetical protein EBR66_00675 [bacterium]|nr:hypothetical protein [bacterium]
MSLEKVLRAVVLTGVFALPFIPFIVSSNLFFPFITGKNFAFRLFVEIAVGAWLALAFVHPQYRPRRSFVLGAFVFYAAALLLSALFSFNPVRSIWSNYERMEGWITIAHLVAYLTVCLSVMTSERLWRNWWMVSMLASIGIGLFGVLQLMGALTINQGGIRLDATLGNATYLGVYMLFHIFIAVLYLVREGGEYWNTTEKAVVGGAALLWLLSVLSLLQGQLSIGKPFFVQFLLAGFGFLLVLTLRRSYALSALIALAATILFFTATRGAMVGLAGGAFLAAITYVVLEPCSRMAWRTGVAVIAALALVGMFYLGRESTFVRNIEPLQRLATMSISDSSFTGRLVNWSMAWNGVKERPILGWGQENYGLVFNKYFDPRMYGQEPWFDRVHEVVLDQLIAGGMVGLLAYLSLYLAALYCLWRSGAFDSVEKSILTGLLAGYFFYLVFTFDNITSWVLFVSLLAFIAVRAALAQQSRVVFTSGGMPLQSLPMVAVVVSVATVASIWYLNGPAYLANRELIQAVTPQRGGVIVNYDHFTKALSYNALGMQEIREHLAQGTAQLANAQSVSEDVKKKFYDLATGEMLTMQKQVPLEARFPLFLGMVYTAYGQFDLSGQEYQKALAISPKKIDILFQAGANALNAKKNDQALAYFKQAYELVPNNDDARTLYVAMAIQVGKLDLAKELTVPLMASDKLYQSRVMNAYAAGKYYKEVIAIVQNHIKLKPYDPQARFTLAAAYYLAGDKQTAIKTLQEAAQQLPDIAQQANQLVDQIKKGTIKI